MELSNRKPGYTINGDDLLLPKFVESHLGEFQCEFMVYNSGDWYILGEVFLRDYYSVYNIDHSRMGLGKVIDFDAPYREPEEPED